MNYQRKSHNQWTRAFNSPPQLFLTTGQIRKLADYNWWLVRGDSYRPSRLIWLICLQTVSDKAQLDFGSVRGNTGCEGGGLKQGDGLNMDRVININRSSSWGSGGNADVGIMRKWLVTGNNGSEEVDKGQVDHSIDLTEDPLATIAGLYNKKYEKTYSVSRLVISIIIYKYKCAN